MLRVLKHEEPWQVALLMNTPAPELGDRTPVEWEKDGGDPRELERLATVLKCELEDNESFESGATTSA